MNLPVHIITCQTPSMNLPAHGTTSPDPSKASLSVKNNTLESKEQQPFRLARPTRRQAKLFQTAWRYLLTARRQRPQGHCFLVTAWRTSPCRQALSHTGTPDASRTARRTYPCRQVLYQQRNPSGFLLATQLV